MKKILMLAAAILAVQALPALAEGGKHDGKRHGAEKFFDKQDTNKDGAVSEEEFMASAKERFGIMDADKDGKITKPEVEAHHAEMKKKWEAKREEMKAKRDAGEAPEAPAAE